MLVLTRRRDESIVIGEDIVITVVDIRGGDVRLGIDSPKEVPIHRREVYEAIRKENEKMKGLGGKLEEKKPAEYADSQHLYTDFLCPNDYVDERLNRQHILY